VEKYGIFKGYSYEQKSQLMQHLLAKLEVFKDEQFHTRVFELLVAKELFDFLPFVNSDYFMNIQSFVHRNPMKILLAGYFHS